MICVCGKPFRVSGTYMCEKCYGGYCSEECVEQCCEEGDADEPEINS